MSILVIVEHDNQTVNEATLGAVTAAQKLSGTLDLLVLGHQCEAVAEQAAKITGVDRVLLADGEHLAHQLAENAAPVIANVGKEYSHILIASTTSGKNLLPRAAALLDSAQISDIIEVCSDDEFVRPIYAGNIYVNVKSSDAIKLITVRTTAFDSAPKEGGQATIEALTDIGQDSGLSCYVESRVEKSDRPDLATAGIVVSGGRGVGSKDNFAIIESLAAQLEAAVGASRAAVDAGYVPNDYQVGQTGKVVAPNLYLAIGISGAIQHLAGMKDSKVIVAINKDEEAPIFQVADYGLVADLFEAVPALEKALSS